MAIAILEVPTFDDIPGFVPSGVLYFTEDTNDLYIGTGASIGPAVTAVSGGSTGDTIQSVNSSRSIGFASGLNTVVKATAGPGGITLTLISAVGVAGQRIAIKKIDSAVGSVMITTSLSQTIDGTLFGSTYSLENFMQYVILESDGANWLIFGAN